MAKETQKKRVVSKKHLARLEREQMQNRYILYASILVLVLVFGFIAFGVIQKTIIEPNQPVAVVNGDEIPTNEFQARVRYMRRNLLSQYVQTANLAGMFGDDPQMEQYFSSSLQQIASQLDSTEGLGQQVLDSLIEDRLIRQEATKRNITIDPEAIDQAMQEGFGFYPNGTPTPTTAPPTPPIPTLSAEQLSLITPNAFQTPAVEATATPEVTMEATGAASEETAEATTEATTEPTLEASPEATSEETGEEASATPSATSTPLPTPTPYTLDAFEADYQAYLDTLKTEINFSEEQMRTLVESQLLFEKVMEAITADISLQQEQIWARQILVATEAEAQTVLDRLENGEDFAVLAAEVSTDQFNKDRGGDMGWFIQEETDPQLWDAVAGLEVGGISEMVQTAQGIHVIQVLGHDVRPLSPEKYEQVKQEKFQEWLDEQRTQAEIETFEYWRQRVPSEPDLTSIQNQPVQ